MENNTFKRNASFEMAGTIDVSDNGVALTNMTGWTGKSEMRDAAGTLIADLNFTWVNAATRAFRLSAPNAASWPLGIHMLDILLTAPDGIRVVTKTQTLEVYEGITRA